MTSAAIAIGLAVYVSAFETCPYRAVNKYDMPPNMPTKTIGCCDAAVGLEFLVAFDDADVDVLVSDLPGQPSQVEAWLTRDTCDRLFDAGASAPRCEILIGPVAPGTISQRKRVPRGKLLIWVRQRNPVQADVTYFVGSTVWRHQCTVAPG